MKRQLSVFISYASEDYEQAADLGFYLAYDGFDPWIDREKLLPGEDWDLKLRSAIEGCDAAIVCLSNASVNKRGYLQKEIRKMLDVAGEIPQGEVFLIPVRLENCPVPDPLKKSQWVNLFESGGYEKLREVLSLRAKALGRRMRASNKPGDLMGIYAAQGTNEDGTQYAGTVLISRFQNTYRVTWKVGTDRFYAEGSLKKGRFVVAGDFNFTYLIRQDGTLFGKWNANATEILKRVPPNSRFITSPIGKFGRIRKH